jgi:hypothetical protein
LSSRIAGGWWWGRQHYLDKKNIVTKSEGVKSGSTCQGRHCKGLNDFRVGSWDVLSLYQLGALKMLLSQPDSYKMDITAIQEIIWTGEGIIDKRKHLKKFDVRVTVHRR